LRIFSLWVSQIAKAPTVIIDTKVTMKGGIDSQATSAPLIRPTRAPAISMARRPNQTCPARMPPFS
jgi:hypothetical protein